MDIDEVELWREAFAYALDNHPEIDWPSIGYSHVIHNRLIKAFIDGARYAANSTKNPDHES